MEKLDKIEIINQLSMRYDPRKKSDFYKNNWEALQKEVEAIELSAFKAVKYFEITE